MMNLPKGFCYAGVACGIKDSEKLDLSLIVSDESAVAAGVYTQNIVRASSIDWNRSITPTASFRGLVVNSGNANACTGSQGVQNNQAMAFQLSKLLETDANQVAVLSTGIIGVQLPMDRIGSGIQSAFDGLANGQDAFHSAATGILTTDQSEKISTVAGSGYQIAGMAKGAGMIGPKMATMLGIIVSDVDLDMDQAQDMIRIAADYSFNRISVEGHTSTNDALILICSGKSGVTLETEASKNDFQQKLNQCCLELAKKIPADGEGASHLIQIKVKGAQNGEEADRIARTIAASALVKTAVTGSDPNWGRIVSAAGYAGVQLDPDKIGLKLNGCSLYESGQPVEFDQRSVSQRISEQFETMIELAVGSGEGNACHWTSDLTVDYVRFNSEYTT
ncbi:MAG: bifunctional glutamate N-acetyltransferase/amino-acid acetyltransferase ArgJ [Planctomycetota bacterium]